MAKATYKSHNFELEAIHWMIQVLETFNGVPNLYSRTELIWATGLLALVLTFEATTATAKQWQARLKEAGALPSQYRFDRIQHKAVVYVKLPYPTVGEQHVQFNPKHVYIGSSHVGLVNRENNRRAKIKMLSKSSMIKAEPA